MIVTISGTPASGKSTIARAVAEHFHLKHYSAGDFLRKIAESRGISLLDICKIAEKDNSIDLQVDGMVVDLGNEDDFVIDSRLAFHFLPHSFKVLVKCSPEVSAGRIFRDSVEGKRPVEGNIASSDDALKITRQRFESEKDRYRKLYRLDYTDESQFDFVIDTSIMAADVAISRTIDAIKKHLKKGQSGSDVWA